MSLTVLRMAVDWLDASVDGHVRPYMLETLECAKQQAQETECPVYAPLDGLDYAVQAQGAKPYRYVLLGDEASIKATDSKRLPGCTVHLSPYGLALYDTEALLRLVLGTVEEWFGPAEEPKLSRLDLCVDFQGFDVAGAHGAQFVSPAEFRPVYPNAEHPQTFQFGRGQVVVRVYNKTRELATGHKSWVPELWEQCAGFDPETDVWRFEVQFRRGALRELDAGSPTDALGRLPELLRYGLGWADLRVPEGKSSNRWPRHPVWEALAEATATHTVLKRQSLRPELADMGRLAAAVGGYAISAGAALQKGDFDEVWSILGSKVRERVGDAFLESTKRRRLERLGREAHA